MNRRQILKCVGIAMTAPVVARADLLTKPVRVIVPWTAGGPTDIQARAICNAWAPLLGQPVIVENRPGASGAMGAVAVARAPKDGTTLLYTVDGPLTQTPHLVKSLPYDPFKDFTMISRSAIGGAVLVCHPSIPVKNVKELVAFAKANPGKLSFSSFGTGTVSHIYGEVLAQSTGIDLVHVPYKGSADAMRDLVAGRVQLMFDSPSIAAQYVSEGTLRMLGAAGDKRRTTMPEVPTLLEQGYAGFEIRGWNGFLGPAGMDSNLADAIHAQLAKAQAAESVLKVWQQTNFEMPVESRADAVQVLRRDHGRWKEYVQKLGLQPT